MKQTPKSKNAILGISIAIVLALFIGYGIDTFYDEPDFEDYCDEKRETIDISNEDDCLALGGQWTSIPTEKKLESNLTKEGYCDAAYTCRKEYDSAREIYNRNVFIITVILGLISLIIGGIKLKLASVSSGIMGGGALMIIYGTLRYWGNLAKIGRLFILGLVLAVLIWIGYKKFK